MLRRVLGACGADVQASGVTAVAGSVVLATRGQRSSFYVVTTQETAVTPKLPERGHGAKPFFSRAPAGNNLSRAFRGLPDSLCWMVG